MSKISGVLLVVGATGSIGQHVVASGLAHGYTLRALVRDGSRAKDFPASVQTVVGDMTRPETLSAAVEGVDAIVFTHGSYGNPAAAADVDYGAVRNVLAALGNRRARIALMSTIGATDRRGSHDWKRRGERLVRASGLPYTIVRPAWFDHNRPDQLQLLMLQGDKDLAGNPTDGVIARRQIAEVLVRSLSSEAALRKTFELHAETGPEQADFDTVFAPLAADPADALDGARDKANMPLAQEPDQIRAELQAVRDRAAG
ncbi:SDR family oxidoreductase [Paracoccus panacisoli]|uniref:SDR family oxidoreductase n=1 Tax=Paracoccus panacisoli TaxID=1510163 RepID=A0ABV6T6S0_9RHOB